jgi:hypothetical protein
VELRLWHALDLQLLAPFEYYACDDATDFSSVPWDRPGEPLHDPEGLQAFVSAMRAAVAPGMRCIELDAHINDAAFADAALAVMDAWVEEGVVPRGVPRG